MGASPSISIAIVGSGGAGALTTVEFPTRNGQRRRVAWPVYAHLRPPDSGW